MNIVATIALVIMALTFAVAFGVYGIRAAWDDRIKQENERHNMDLKLQEMKGELKLLQERLNSRWGDRDQERIENASMGVRSTFIDLEILANKLSNAASHLEALQKEGPRCVGNGTNKSKREEA